MKFIVWFSWGIDSTFIARILKSQWHQVLLINLKNTIEPNKCCWLDKDLFNLAKKLDLKLEIINVIEEFKNFVINEFIKSYKNWETPNPCINCNEYVRFVVLDYIRKKYNYEFITTWHYAITHTSPKWNILKKWIDNKKDQSYMLYRLINKPFFQNIKFIMWKFKKENIKKLIKEKKIPHITMKESQNICFVPDDDYPRYIKQNTNLKYEPWPIYDVHWNYLWEHKWIIYYTIWQKKWLNIWKKLYVVKIDTKSNSIIVWEEKELYKNELIISNFLTYNWIDIDNLNILAKNNNLKWKIRYHHNWENISKITKINNNELKITFQKPVRAPTPWQHLVLYSNNIVLWWWIIK